MCIMLGLEGGKGRGNSHSWIHMQGRMGGAVAAYLSHWSYSTFHLWGFCWNMLRLYGIPTLWNMLKPLNLWEICCQSMYKSPYRERLHMLNLPTLEARHQALKLCYLYKLIHDLVFLPNCPLNYRQNLMSTRSSTYTIQVPFAHSNRYYFSFCNGIIIVIDITSPFAME